MKRETISYLAARAAMPDIVSTMERYLELEHKPGKKSWLPFFSRDETYICNCPFHPDNKKSLGIVPKLQVWHCFGCHKGGDVNTFLKLMKEKLEQLK